MVLTEVHISGYGPYSEGADLKIDENVTVLTGANDTGKSVTLRAISLLNGTQETNENDRNSEVFEGESGVWFKFQVDSEKESESDSDVREIELRYDILDGGLDVVRVVDNSGNEIEEHQATRPSPRVIFIRVGEAIRSEFQLRSANPTEILLLRLSFGSDYDRAIARMDSRKLRRINGNLSQNLRSIVPPDAELRIELLPLHDGHPKLAVDIGDGFGSITSIEQRGSGYNRLISYLLLIATVNFTSGPVILLIDEPETSLHADAQHTLRNYFEKIASRPNVQVIYATHSTAMIPLNRPESLRLLTRETIAEGVATTRIENKTYTESNFQSVRAQLGVLPADSLMFASIGIIVEGPTERLTLARLIDKLTSEGDSNKYPNLKLHWHLCFIVSAGGTGEFRKWIEFAKAQNVSVIALLDGDAIKLKRELKQENPDIKVVSCDEGKEIEEVVDESKYFEALETVVPGNHNGMKKKYDAWLSQSPTAMEKMFSKRVDMWLQEELDTRLDKPKVMAKAIDLAQMDQINWTKIDELIDKIREAAENLG